MGYWVTMYLVIAVEEHLIFRRSFRFNWEAWTDLSKLPIGIHRGAVGLFEWLGWGYTFYGSSVVCWTDCEDGW